MIRVPFIAVLGSCSSPGVGLLPAAYTMRRPTGTVERLCVEVFLKASHRSWDLGIGRFHSCSAGKASTGRVFESARARLVEVISC